MTRLESIGSSLWNIVVDLAGLVVELLGFALSWSLLLAWIAWWLLGVNWSKAWPALARGAWAPLVLLMVVSAFAWSRISPATSEYLGFAMPNFWWQLGAVGLLVAFTLFLGWLQGIFGWTPAEIDLDPPVHAEHGHGHH